MSYGYIRHADGSLEFVEWIAIDTGATPPPRPHPQPPDPGQPPQVSHPIALPGDPWWGQDLKPEHPIVLPPEGETPPNVPPGAGQTNCRWGYTEDKGWLLFCVYDPQGGGKPRPPAGPA